MAGGGGQWAAEQRGFIQTKAPASTTRVGGKCKQEVKPVCRAALSEGGEERRGEALAAAASSGSS